MFYNDEKMTQLKKALDSFPTPDKVKNSKKVPYAWIANIEFERISKLLEKGATFVSLFEHLMLNDLLPEDGDEAKLRQAYRREEKRRKNISNTAE
jgi:thiamine monophosphate synthase